MIPMRLLYPVCRFFLFLLSPEAAHAVTFKMLKVADKLKLSFLYRQKMQNKPVSVMGIDFPNGVGLAAGLDKNGAYLDGLEPLGFGFIEVGTVTPKPQPGNPKPRMFRLVSDSALINRMGFNNQGIDAMISHIRKSKYYQQGGIIGINIGKNFNTPLDKAVEDYLICFEKAYLYASYIAVNISSPNTPDLRNLQHGDYLDELLGAIKLRQAELSKRYNRYVPVAVKIAPDLTETEIDDIADKLLAHHIDGVIATNTTITRDGLTETTSEAGGLSGKPLRNLSDNVLARLAEKLAGRLPIIGVGGISSASDALKKRDLGASLVQIYSGFIFEGPALIVDCVNKLAKEK